MSSFVADSLVGTPLWMAPEVKMGTYGFPSDIYSLGLVLYEIFEKKLPDYDPNTQRTTVPMQFQVPKALNYFDILSRLVRTRCAPLH